MSIKDERGVALVLALAVIALLASLVVDFSYTMMIDLTLAANLRDEHKAFYVARSGIEMAGHILQEDDNEYDGLDEDWAQFGEHPGYLTEDDEGRFKGTIEDEASKIAINTLIGEGGAIDTTRLDQLERLFELLELDPALIDAIVDWLDPDNTAGPSGAEDSYYEGLSSPYPCKDGPLATIDELLLVKGITEEILYGRDEQAGLMQYLTIYSDGMVNINTAPCVVLQSLSDEIDEGLAQTIIDYRQEEPFKNIDEIKIVPGMEPIYDSIKNEITLESSIFMLRVKGQVRGIKKGIFAVLKRDGEAVKPLFWRVE